MWLLLYPAGVLLFYDHGLGWVLGYLIVGALAVHSALTRFHGKALDTLLSNHAGAAWLYGLFAILVPIAVALLLMIAWLIAA